MKNVVVHNLVFPSCIQLSLTKDLPMTRTSTKRKLSTSFRVVCYALLIFVVFPIVVVLSRQGEIKRRKGRWTDRKAAEKSTTATRSKKHKKKGKKGSGCWYCCNNELHVSVARIARIVSHTLLADGPLFSPKFTNHHVCQTFSFSEQSSMVRSTELR